MNKTLAKKLLYKAEEVAKDFSNTNREYNFNNEIFQVASIKPLSERCAAVCYKKNTGKFALAFFYYLKGIEDGYWQYFFPTESHIHGMKLLPELLLKVEEQNFNLNFIGEH